MDCSAAQNVVARGWQELSLHFPGESRFSVCYFSVLGNFMGFNTPPPKKRAGGLRFSLSTQWFVFLPHSSMGRAGLVKLNHF